MTLIVDLSALTGYARQLGRAADNAEAVTGYIAKYSDISTGTGLDTPVGELNGIAYEGHRRTASELDSTLGRLTDLLGSSTRELTAAAQYYRRTDLVAADAIDRSLAPVPDRCPTPLEYEVTALTCPPAAFADSYQITDRLSPPPVPDSPLNPLAFLDNLSPTSWVVEALRAVFGFDPISWLMQRLVGDWEGLATMRPVLANAADALHDLALNVQSGATSLNAHWQGNAAAAAYRYFTDLATAITTLETQLKQMCEAYRMMADAVWAGCEALGGLATGIIDYAIVVGIMAAAGTVTASTGIGALIGYGVAAMQIAKMLKLWESAAWIYEELVAAVLAFRAEIGSGVSDLGNIRLPQLPGTGYDHPWVSPDGHHG